MFRYVTRLPAWAQRVLICVNPKAGARAQHHRLARLKTLLREEGFEVESHTDLERVSRLAAELTAKGELRALVAAGGDGTAAALVNRTPSGTPLALFPLGTENILSKYIGQSRSAAGVCRMICDGLTLQFDAGSAGGRLFLLMITAGFDADVVRRIDEERTGHITHRAWIKRTWETIRGYAYPPLRVYCAPEGGEPLDSQPRAARWVMAANLPRYAQGLNFVPDATGTDGRLDLCLFQGKSWMDSFRLLAAVWCQRHKRLHDCTLLQSGRVRIESDRPVAYQMDGDWGGWLPVDVEVLPERFQLIVPRPFAEQSGLAMAPAGRRLEHSPVGADALR